MFPHTYCQALPQLSSVTFNYLPQVVSTQPFGSGLLELPLGTILRMAPHTLSGLYIFINPVIFSTFRFCYVLTLSMQILQMRRAKAMKGINMLIISLDEQGLGIIKKAQLGFCVKLEARPSISLAKIERYSSKLYDNVLR